MIQIKHIRLDKLLPPEFDMRITTSEEEDRDLMESIRELGILEPLLVKDTTAGYEIIAGNRRFRAAGIAGLPAVPCIVVKTTGAESEKIALHENLKRLPLSHVDQAYMFAHMIKKYVMTETQIATLVKKSIAYVSQHLSLLQCEEKLIESVHSGRINFSVARELFRCKDLDDRSRIQNIVEANGATSNVVQNWVNESNKETAIIDGQTPKPPPYISNERTQIPYFPCRACEKPTPVLELKTVRLCPECNQLIFSEIDLEKFKIRAKQPV